MKKDKKEKKEKKEKRASAPQPVIPAVKRNVDLDSLPQDPLEYALSRVGGKWKLRILWGLGQSSESGGLRYGDLKEKIPGITDMMFCLCQVNPKRFFYFPVEIRQEFFFLLRSKPWNTFSDYICQILAF